MIYDILVTKKTLVARTTAEKILLVEGSEKGIYQKSHLPVHLWCFFPSLHLLKQPSPHRRASSKISDKLTG